MSLCEFTSWRRCRVKEPARARALGRRPVQTRAHTRDVAMVTPVNATDNPVDPESAEEKQGSRDTPPRASVRRDGSPHMAHIPRPFHPFAPLRSSSTRRTRTSSSRSCSWAGPRSAVPPRTSASSRRRSWRCARGASRPPSHPYNLSPSRASPSTVPPFAPSPRSPPSPTLIFSG